MRKHLLLRTTMIVTLLVAAITAWAQIPTGYYDSAQGKTGDALKVALHNIIKGHKVVSYSGLLTAYGHTDTDENGNIIDIYSNYHYSINGDCGQYHKEGDCWNREHAWPQSWFGSGTPKSDLFHVYPTDGYVNGRRSNNPYGEVSSPTYTSGNGSKLGPCKTSLGYSGTVFEPIDEYKGDIARTYFYMSVRYYSEDGSWKSSGMTEKSVIKPWAMKMLLKWSDEDPVSQKEIDRNNAIYNIYQHNRNPFIDHPEYAHMIWDADWTGGNVYAVTCASPLEHGSITAPATALEGTTVSVTPLPDAGYEVDTWSAWMTAAPQTTVAMSSDGTFTMPGGPVTVSATFRQNTTLYAINILQPEGGTITASHQQALSGTTIQLNATPAEAGAQPTWFVYRTGDITTKVSVNADGTFTMPPYDVTVTATFAAQGELAYERVTTAPDDWSGQYLIVYEDGKLAFNGSLSKLDAVRNTLSVDINDSRITYTESTAEAEFTITPGSDGTYSLRSASGFYVGRGSDANGLEQDEDATKFVNSINIVNGEADIVSGNAHLRYNASSGQERFRYYKSSTYNGQKAVQLYRKSGGSQQPVQTTATITFHGPDGQTYTQTVEKMQPEQLIPCTFTKSGFEFEGWSTESDGSGDFYTDGSEITVIADTDLWAQWEELYTVTCLTTEGGTVTASPTEATAGTIITITATAEEDYELESLTITDDLDNILYAVDDAFEMPSAPVTVSATFTFTGTTGIKATEAAKAATATFDLQGRQVATPKAKGIYISQGKKIVR